MERLTFEGNFCDIAQCRDLMCQQSGTCTQRQVWERLKAYEDTGLEPEAVETVKLALVAKHMVDLETLNNTPISRLVELAEADKDGRCVVLPCKVGDVVYGFHNNRQTILPMVAKWIETNADGWTVAAQYAPMAPKFFQFSDFGKTVFLTREEAEKAMEGMENGNKTSL